MRCLMEFCMHNVQAQVTGALATVPCRYFLDLVFFKFMESKNVNNTFRDLAIDAALCAIFRLIEPSISNAEIQRRGGMQIYGWGYTVGLDGNVVAAVELDGSRRFSITILSSNSDSAGAKSPGAGC